MIPKRWVEAYLRFLLRNRLLVTLAIAGMTVFFAIECSRIKIIANFIDFYPSEMRLTLFGKEIIHREGHPYIKIYNDFRRMFGSANVLTAILEVKQGDIYNPTTLQKLDPLPNGTYSFSMDVERAANLNDQYLFARGCKAGEPTGEVTQSTAAAGSSGLSKITLSNIEVTSGSCTVGIYTDAPADGWANIDNAVVSLQ